MAMLQVVLLGVSQVLEASKTNSELFGIKDRSANP